jgi:type IV pilus assembly protein PilX
MLITLIAMVVLMIGAVAMVRSFDTSSILAGNLAFRRDLTNQGERGIALARAAFTGSGALSAETARNSDLLNSANYSSIKLETNAQGIPKLLVKDSLFSSAGMTETTDSTQGITVRYVVDRQCTGHGPPDDSSCVIATGSPDPSGSAWLQKPGGESRPVYRVSVRVTGPRNTQAFFQTTFAY